MGIKKRTQILIQTDGIDSRYDSVLYKEKSFNMFLFYN